MLLPASRQHTEPGHWLHLYGHGCWCSNLNFWTFKNDIADSRCKKGRFSKVDIIEGKILKFSEHGRNHKCL